MQQTPIVAKPIIAMLEMTKSDGSTQEVTWEKFVDVVMMRNQTATQFTMVESGVVLLQSGYSADGKYFNLAGVSFKRVE